MADLPGVSEDRIDYSHAFTHVSFIASEVECTRLDGGRDEGHLDGGRNRQERLESPLQIQLNWTDADELKDRNQPVEVALRVEIVRPELVRLAVRIVGRWRRASDEEDDLSGLAVTTFVAQEAIPRLVAVAGFKFSEMSRSAGVPTPLFPPALEWDLARLILAESSGDDQTEGPSDG